jgi:hypothetical protein
MTAILANESGRLKRLTEDFDSTPTATWAEDWSGSKWSWCNMTTEPFGEVVKEYTDKGFVCLAIED